MEYLPPLQHGAPQPPRLLTVGPASDLLRKIAGYGSRDLVRYYVKVGRLPVIWATFGRLSLRLLHEHHVVQLATELEARRHRRAATAARAD